MKLAKVVPKDCSLSPPDGEGRAGGAEVERVGGVGAAVADHRQRGAAVVAGAAGTPVEVEVGNRRGGAGDRHRVHAVRGRWSVLAGSESVGARSGVLLVVRVMVLEPLTSPVVKVSPT